MVHRADCAHSRGCSQVEGAGPIICKRKQRALQVRTVGTGDAFDHSLMNSTDDGVVSCGSRKERTRAKKHRCAVVLRCESLLAHDVDNERASVGFRGVDVAVGHELLTPGCPGHACGNGRIRGEASQR